MKFDVAIIGAGLAGLTCGIKLAQAGQRCTIISSGQCALNFSSGSLDLLSRLPNGHAVATPLQALDQLATQAPQHPYTRIGYQAITQATTQFSQMLADSGILMHGSAQHNHLRMTPLGSLRSTWLSPASVPVHPLSSHAEHSDDSVAMRSKIALIGIEGFHDFQPEMAAATLREHPLYRHCDIVTDHLTLPQLDLLRTNPSEFRSVNIARVLEQLTDLAPLAAELQRAAQQAQTVILPAVLGLEQHDLLARLQTLTGLTLLELPTLPPSVLGIRLQQALKRRFQQLGGLLMNGDQVRRATLESGRVQALYTRNHEDIPVQADYVVLASGSFFSNGLVAEFDCIREPIFGLDVVDTGERAQWSNPQFLTSQPFLQFGAQVDNQLRARKAGKTIENLYVIGSVLGGYDPIYLGCGAGVSVTTALTVAEQILQRQEAHA
ncbi:MAG: anaerobic glycerol-3-phosphate dehydrogenase subunit GlpB [Plesiomonas sp.]